MLCLLSVPHLKLLAPTFIKLSPMKSSAAWKLRACRGRSNGRVQALIGTP